MHVRRVTTLIRPTLPLLGGARECRTPRHMHAGNCTPLAAGPAPIILALCLAVNPPPPILTPPLCSCDMQTIHSSTQTITAPRRPTNIQKPHTASGGRRSWAVCTLCSMERARPLPWSRSCPFQTRPQPLPQRPFPQGPLVATGAQRGNAVVEAHGRSGHASAVAAQSSPGLYCCPGAPRSQVPSSGSAAAHRRDVGIQEQGRWLGGLPLQRRYKRWVAQVFRGRCTGRAPQTG